MLAFIPLDVGTFSGWARGLPQHPPFIFLKKGGTKIEKQG
jgi:hypothetical protein